MIGIPHKATLKAIPFLLSLLSFSVIVSAQALPDTLYLSAATAEKIFIENNLPLLAERLNINQADAHILQAKAWPNPTLNVGEIQIYNNASTDRSPPLFGNFWRNRTFAVSLEQLILTAGKRKKNIAIQTGNKALAESTFTDFLQALKAEFRKSIAELIYMQQVQGDWYFQIETVNKLLSAQKSQLREGNISQAEYFRLKALQISLQTQINDLEEDLTEQQMNLKIFMNLNPNIFLVMNYPEKDKSLQLLGKYTLEDLMAQSLQHNSEIRITKDERTVSEAELALEKAQRVPDVTFNVNYDRNGSNQLNFLGAGFSFGLPALDRNKGNIKAAGIEIQKNSLMEKRKVSEVSNKLEKTWSDLHKAVKLYQSMDQEYVAKLEELSVSISKSFIQRNLSLLEFLDYFESFRESKEKYYETLKNISLKKEDLNYLTGNELW